MNARLLDSDVEFQAIQPRIVMFLPILGTDIPFINPPEAETQDAPEDSAEASEKAPPKAPAKKSVEEPSVASIPSKEGLSYPGPQPILSNPPDPTNRIQTVLQPSIEDPEILVPPLSLPNLVQFADASLDERLELPQDIGPVEPPPVKVEPERPPMTNPLEDLHPMESRPPKPLEFQPAEAPEVKLEMPPVKVAPPSLMEEPKLVLPPMLANVPEPPPEEPAPQEESTVAQVTLEEAEAFLAKTLPRRKADSRASSASPKLSGERASTEIAERHQERALPNSSPLAGAGSGQQDLLALTPMPARIGLPVHIPSGEARGSFAISPEPNLDTSETEPGTKVETSSSEVGLAVQSAVPSGNSASQGVVRGITFGSGAGNAKTENSSVQAFGSGKGGSGAGSGKSAGAGAGNRAFSGITIVGGGYDPGASADPDPVVQAPKPIQSSYTIAVISTENSGGGLPFVGVFSNEQIYTVYLDMREKESDPTPSWTLEFALLPTITASATITFDSKKSQEGLILPYPITKEQPALPVDLVQKHLNELVIVYAIINGDGKMKQVSVKQSPDILLNDPLLDCLKKWTFRPARLNGKPVAAKMLMGIPLSLSQ